MAAFNVTLEAPVSREVVPGDFVVRATLTNAASEPAALNRSQASRAPLVLQVRDGADQPVLLPPPPPPTAADFAAEEAMAPGQTVSFEYGGFLDRSLPPGIYSVRYFSPYPALGGAPDDPVQSDWLVFHVREPEQVFPFGEPLPTRPVPRREEIFPFDWIRRLLEWLRRWLHRLLCWLARLLLGRLCDRVLTREVDEARTQTISNAPPGSEAWNGTYGWRSRFHVRVDEAECRVTVTVRVRLSGTITQAQQDAWESAIQNAWSNLFKLCCTCCCCGDGYTMVADLQFVSSGEHQVVNVGNATTNMTNWDRNDTVDVRHEFGHMLGALDEYFTVNGVDHGAPRQPGGNIMNNPANNPAAHHYDLIRDAAQNLLGTDCSTAGVGERC